jgi:hypothetical protein
MVTDLAGLRALSVKLEGARAMYCATMPGSQRTIRSSLFTSAPAAARRSLASLLSTFMPISASTRSEAVWMAST